MKIFKLKLKIAAALLLAMLSAFTFACKPQNPTPQNDVPSTAPQGDQIPDENTVKVTLDPNATPAPVVNVNGYSYEFVRINYSENANGAEPVVITGTEQLRDAIDNNLFSGARSRASADEFLRRYDEEFFKTNYLLVFNLTFSSGSVIPKIKSVTLENGVVNIVTEGEMNGDVGTADMASHMCLLALDPAKFPASSTFSVSGAGTVNNGSAKMS